jgi:hypothetical protein
LQLHTSRGLSGLPGFPMPKSYPPYPSRQQVVDYLEAYREHFDLRPRYGQTVKSVRREGDSWRVETTKDVFRGRRVVVATGYTRQPIRPRWLGMDDYTGELLHSSEYFAIEHIRPGHPQDNGRHERMHRKDETMKLAGVNSCSSKAASTTLSSTSTASDLTRRSTWECPPSTTPAPLGPTRGCRALTTPFTTRRSPSPPAVASAKCNPCVRVAP